MNIGILANLTKTDTENVADRLMRELEARGHDCFIEKELSGRIGRRKGLLPEEVCEKAELILSLGGDGSVLHAVNAAAPLQKPVLGINMGRVGFLSEVPPAEIAVLLDAIDDGNFSLDKRSMLQSTVVEKEGESPEQWHYSLNDVSITRDKYACIVRLDVFVQDAYAGNITGDGVVISTPTGSSAYALSCGGPLVHPSLDVIVIAPISGHMTSMRPMVVPGDSVIRVRALDSNRALDLVADGKFGARLSDGEAVIRRAPFQALLAHIKPYCYYDIVRSKIYGENVVPPDQKGIRCEE